VTGSGSGPADLRRGRGGRLPRVNRLLSTQKLALFDLDDTLVDRTWGFRSVFAAFALASVVTDDMEQWRCSQRPGTR